VTVRIPLPPGWTPPRREELARCPRDVIDPGSTTKAAVLRVEHGGIPVIVKDVSVQHRLARWLYGRRILRREERALRVLDGRAGAPRLLGRIDEDALVQEFLPGKPLVKVRDQEEKVSAVCRNLGRRIDELHRHGVVHLDLRQYRNILVDEDLQVSLIDFESAMVLGHGLWGRLAGAWMRRVDRGACLKIKAKFAYAALTREERRAYRRQDFWSRLWVFNRLGSFLRLMLGRGRHRSNGRDS
jgi:predicted Ser/Thr protein kinase